MKILSVTAALAMSLSASPLFANDRPGEGVTVRPVVQPVLEEYFQARIIDRALTELGYTVAQPQEVIAQTAHLAVGTGDADYFTNSWDQLHNTFFNEAGGPDVMTKVGTLVEGALQGYLVDKASYDAGVKNLGDFKDPEVARKFDADGDGKADLAGCVPGWGCERVIEHALTEYGLRDTITHNQGEYNAIIADTIARVANGEPVLYFTWTPYWVSGALVPGKDVEWLDVPYTSLPDGATGNTEFGGKNLGFAVDNLRIIARNDFLEANPAAAKLFEVAKVSINDISAENKQIADGEKNSDDIDRHVDAWIKAHQAEYDGWLAAARDAAK
ncbi:glycine betaine/L-proline ABC transporter substrate-binding protein ProX [Shinella daejeonensis]|uniref:glycine betaine/L-proline ABC transporter substrate-binding protein ProX n=1 Tax=Shinella daejeonensis TaxID=659017 RepID=UPI0020C7AD27|nr:glycine betaine/L-proline ABC transporter substrate-binding protein ProX [Shinella daejeonensis]MCP8895130.1 glycine betaine/L-proline ABC transporter substrate-binding protein ProX [Shinella daejeonensis]